MQYFWSVFPGEVGLCSQPCVQSLHDSARFFKWSFTIPRPNGIHTLNDSDREATFISSLTLAQYHKHCYFVLAEHRKIMFSVPAAVNLGTVLHYSCSTRLKSPVEITSLLPELKLSHSFYSGWTLCVDHHMMENKWIRCDTRQGLPFGLYMTVSVTGDKHPWLSQSNYIRKKT
ncbi:hypothetical protein C8F01DRAFT_1129544, partial [Mycena amicta]